MLAICTASTLRGAERRRCFTHAISRVQSDSVFKDRGEGLPPERAAEPSPGLRVCQRGVSGFSFAALVCLVGRTVRPFPGWLVASLGGPNPGGSVDSALWAEASGCQSGDLPRGGESFRRAAVGGRYLDLFPGVGKEIFTLVLISAGRAPNCG